MAKKPSKSGPPWTLRDVQALKKFVERGLTSTAIAAAMHRTVSSVRTKIKHQRISALASRGLPDPENATSNAGKLWSSAEVKSLRQLTKGHLNSRDIAEKLKRTRSSIRAKAKELKIRFTSVKRRKRNPRDIPERDGKLWTQAEIVRLQTLAHQGLSSFDIAERMERTRDAVKSKAKSCGITWGLPGSKRARMEIPVKSGYPWSAADVKQLRLYAKSGKTSTEVAKLVERTKESVRTKAKDLSIHFGDRKKRTSRKHLNTSGKSGTKKTTSRNK